MRPDPLDFSIHACVHDLTIPRRSRCGYRLGTVFAAGQDIGRGLSVRGERHEADGGEDQFMH